MNMRPLRPETPQIAELLAAIQENSQCSVKVSDCDKVKSIVKVPNQYRQDIHGKWSYCLFCQQCLRKSPPVNNLSTEEKSSAREWNSSQVESAKEAKRHRVSGYYAKISELRDEQRRQEESEGRKYYEDHLKSPEWKKRRAAVIARCSGVCEGCMSRPVNHVHHLTYEHLGNELLFELVGLCVNCHAICHPDKEFNQ